MKSVVAIAVLLVGLLAGSAQAQQFSLTLNMPAPGPVTVTVPPNTTAFVNGVNYTVTGTLTLTPVPVAALPTAAPKIGSLLPASSHPLKLADITGAELLAALKIGSDLIMPDVSLGYRDRTLYRCLSHDPIKRQIIPPAQK